VTPATATPVPAPDPRAIQHDQSVQQPPKSCQTLLLVVVLVPSLELVAASPGNLSHQPHLRFQEELLLLLSLRRNITGVLWRHSTHHPTQPGSSRQKLLLLLHTAGSVLRPCG